ncbi:MAG: mechanosensitive ion channel family protein [Burkholderiaceae bacterium]|nr:mechanosensitive ion channel family protein [Burkholderiaceae bacterium]MDH3459963.1 mechanosensitive ion channel family protein [Burkholderiaceae bacterium]
MDQLFDVIKPWLVSMGLLAALIAAGLVLHAILYAVARRVATHIRGSFDELLISHTRRPARVLLPLMLVTFTWPSLQLATDTPAIGHRVLSIAFIAVGAWFIVAVLAAMVDWVTQRYRVDVDDNLRAREIQTKALVLKRIATLVIIVVGSALVLLQIPGIENVGASLLASAGLAGIVVGIAARPTVANLLAGIQLALTQPIRIDDVVIVEGEWGRIEEIRNTFVVVRIWDLRRLMVPLSHFIEKPFENWTRVTADLLGTVFVYVDYTTPIEDVRRELKTILESSELWDGKVWNLQVTDTTERTVKLRALMSASDASTAWDLRCYVRERLIEYLQRQHPEALPRARADVLAKMNPDAAQKLGGQALAAE